MAAGDSPTSICNLGLAMLGEPQISNFDPPDNTKAGRLCRQFYDPSRRSILEMAKWRIAKKQAQLAASTTRPLFGGAAYPLPADFISFYDKAHADRLGWQVENLDGVGRVLIAHDGPPFDCEYIFDLVDCTIMPPLMVRGIAADVASYLAIPLTRDMSLRTAAEATRDAAIAQARSSSAQQASPREWEVDVLLDSRW